MVTATTEEKVAEKMAFVMRVLKHTEMSKPNWKAIAAEEGISRSDNAQQKFRKTVESLGYAFVNDQIVDLKDGEGGAGGASAAATPGTKTGTTTTPTKKRKSPAKKDKETNGGETPSKKSKTTLPAPAGGRDSGEVEATKAQSQTE
ncbi:hypothetical protein G647_01750 [Cladophialophora carrionii CBS 160.54]|uniref:Myb-like DNA-binding domain-containing protein n=1 Tax=Cladophialophora carrionii CBS 160.54 TaxID=1279043 RepID=V9DTI5_9EURO|nr:uncharacterized protein G647_01750 [Cladophialophora carrionii CBS 160.54]ETI29297.1 hypothetical protein G647_01750 [Cladophialophora carrionii CBS 160.54]